MLVKSLLKTKRRITVNYLFIKNLLSPSKSSTDLSKEQKEKSYLNFLEAIYLLKKERELLGISRQELSRRTKISVVVIEAIENGWKDQLPERTFLQKMLRILEYELKLPRNSLISILNESNKPKNKPAKRLFNTGNILIFSSWHGNIVYLLLMILSIFLINQPNKDLREKNNNLNNQISDEFILLDKLKESNSKD